MWRSNKYRELNFNRDVLITVKTKEENYNRTVILIQTWIKLVKNQTFIVSDYRDNNNYDNLIRTNCSRIYDDSKRLELSCKLGVEYDLFVKSHLSWWCHFDDDNYVNLRALNKLLGKFNPNRAFYLGKPSTAKPLSLNGLNFWFATGGAGFCLSRAMANKIMPYAR